MGKDDEFDYSVLDTSALVYLFIPESLNGRFGGNGTNREIEVDTELNRSKKIKLLKTQDYFEKNKNRHNFVITPTIKERI